MLKTLQNFYKATTSRAWAIGTGNRYVSTLPTPSAGYLVISPSDTSKREIIAYSGTGTDSLGSYVTVTTRGVGGTTEQAHSKNEPIRMNIIAQHYSEVQDEVTDLQGQIDTLVLQNAPNASTTTRGIVLMSTAPSEAGTAIVVATTDPKYTKIDDIPDHFVSVSTGAGDAGSGVVLNASGQIDYSMGVRFGGDGSDGALAISSGTTTIDLANAKVLVKNYSSISITGTGKLAFSNPNTNGTIIILRSQGNVTLTSSTAPMIDASGLGGAGGSGGTANAANRAIQAGSNGNSLFRLFTGGATNTSGGAALAENATILSLSNTLTYQKILASYPYLFTGAGGASGGITYNGGGSTATVGSGGTGGGGLVIECAGYWNFTTTNGISVAGADAGSSSIAGGQYAVNGSGGGGGGFFLGLYNLLTANTGTVNVSGGTGGIYYESYNDTGTGAGGGGGYLVGNGGSVQGTNGVKNGGDGGVGFSLIEQNKYFA